MVLWLVLWFHVVVYINTGCIWYGAVVGTVVSRCGLYLHWLYLVWRCGFTRWSVSALALKKKKKKNSSVVRRVIYICTGCSLALWFGFTRWSTCLYSGFVRHSAMISRGGLY